MPRRRLGLAAGAQKVVSGFPYTWASAVGGSAAFMSEVIVWAGSWWSAASCSRIRCVVAALVAALVASTAVRTAAMLWLLLPLLMPCA